MTQMKMMPVTEICAGEVTAQIFERHTTDGYRYFEYSLVRQHGGRKRSTFFETTKSDIDEATKLASKWIREEGPRYKMGSA